MPISRECADAAVIGAFCGIAACQRNARGEMHQGCGQVVDIVTFGDKRRRGAGVGEVSHEVRRAVHIDERSAGAPDQNAHVDPEWLELAVALGYDGEQARASLFDMGGAGFSVLVGVNAGIGKERSCLIPASVGEQLRTTAVWYVGMSMVRVTMLLSGPQLLA